MHLGIFSSRVSVPDGKDLDLISVFWLPEGGEYDPLALNV